MKKNTGMTLIEVIVSIALMGLVVTGAYSLINFTRLYLQKSRAEYEFQFSTRYALQQTGDVIRYSTAVFTIPESSFSAGHLDSGWDYIGIVDTDDGQQIVKYTYDMDTNTHFESVLVPPQKDVRYEFVFSSVDPSHEDTLLNFSIRSYPAGSVDEHGEEVPAVTVTSEVSSQNSLQIYDLSTPPADPAVAIAFRAQERIQSVVGHVAMVLDTSGSMSDYLGAKTRIETLRDRAKDVINEFAREDNIDIKLVPFSTSANASSDSEFLSSKDPALITAVNALRALGGTNTGDGLRRAYWALYRHNEEAGAGVRPSNYLVILVDGDSNFASIDHYVSNAADATFITGEGSVNEGYLNISPYDRTNGNIAGPGNGWDQPYGAKYVQLIGENQIRGFARVYVIGFAGEGSASVAQIANACGARPENVFTANDEAALQEAFSDIRQDIVNDLWYLQGPQL